MREESFGVRHYLEKNRKQWYGKRKKWGKLTDMGRQACAFEVGGSPG